MMPILIDSNILLRVCDRAASEHLVCVESLSLIAQRNDEPCICAQIMIELWAVATRPRSVNGLSMSIADASQALDDALRLATCLPEPPDIAQRWRRLVSQFDVQGKQAHDARLVALMQAHGVRRLLTLNISDFRRYTMVEAIRPGNLLA